MAGFTKCSAETEAMSMEGSKYSGESLTSPVVHSDIGTLQMLSHIWRRSPPMAEERG